MKKKPKLPRAPLPRQTGGAHRVKKRVGRKVKHKKPPDPEGIDLKIDVDKFKELCIAQAQTALQDITGPGSGPFRELVGTEVAAEVIKLIEDDIKQLQTWKTQGEVKDGTRTTA
jgi:hypothetical protein